MVRIDSICEFVQDGDTFRTTGQAWIRLARVNAPRAGTLAWGVAKMELSGLILSKAIAYESAATDDSGRVVAEVWTGDVNVNDHMRAQGYAE